MNAFKLFSYAAISIVLTSAILPEVRAEDYAIPEPSMSYDAGGDYVPQMGEAEDPYDSSMDTPLDFQNNTGTPTESMEAPLVPQSDYFQPSEPMMDSIPETSESY